MPIRTTRSSTPYRYSHVSPLCAAASLFLLYHPAPAPARCPLLSRVSLSCLCIVLSLTESLTALERPHDSGGRARGTGLPVLGDLLHDSHGLKGSRTSHCDQRALRALKSQVPHDALYFCGRCCFAIEGRLWNETTGCALPSLQYPSVILFQNHQIILSLICPRLQS